MIYPKEKFEEKFQYEYYYEAPPKKQYIVYKLSVYDGENGQWFYPVPHNYGFWSHQDAEEYAAVFYPNDLIDIEKQYIGGLPGPMINWEKSKQQHYMIEVDSCKETK